MFKRKVQNDRLVLRGSGLNNLRSDGVEKILKDDVMFFYFILGGLGLLHTTADVK